jgi:hypothetical protein
MVLHILIFMSSGQSMGKDEILDTIIAGIPEFNMLFIQTCHFHLPVLFSHIWTCHIFKDLILSLSVCFYPAFYSWDMNIFFACQYGLLDTTLTSCIYFFIAFMFLHSKLTSSAYRRKWYIPFNFNPPCFTRTFLISHSKAKLKAMMIKKNPEYGEYQTIVHLSRYYYRFHLTLCVWRPFKI